MARKPRSTNKNTSAPAKTEAIADEKATAAAPDAVEANTPAPAEVAKPVVATVEDAPLAGAGKAEAEGDFLPPTGGENALQAIQQVATHAIAAVPLKGFCRAGRRWYREETPVNRADFTDEQWAALEGEPNLVIHELL